MTVKCRNKHLRAHGGQLQTFRSLAAVITPPSDPFPTLPLPPNSGKSELTISSENIKTLLLNAGIRTAGNPGTTGADDRPL